MTLKRLLPYIFTFYATDAITRAATPSSSPRTVILVVTPVLDEYAMRMFATTLPPLTVLPSSLRRLLRLFARSANLLPQVVEVARISGDDVVATAEVEFRHLVFVVVARLLGLVCGQLLGLDDEYLFQILLVGGRRHHRDVLQDRVGERVVDLVLQHDVLLEDVLDDRDDVLGLRLGELDHGRRLEHAAKLLHFGDLHQLLGVTLRLGARAGGRLGAARWRLGRAGLWCFQLSSHLVVLLSHQLQVQGGSISDLVIDVVQAAGKQNLDAALDVRILLADAKLGKGRDGGSADNGVLEHDAVVDVANVLCGLGRLGPFEADEVQDADGQLGEFAVFDELAEPPSSRRMPLRKVSIPACLLGNLRHRVRMASTMVILNSSVMSDMKPEICFISLSTLASLPVLSRVVMAKVAMDRFELEMRSSMSALHTLTAAGLKEAKPWRIRRAANLVTARGEVRNSCRTWTAWFTSASETSRMSQMAFAASKLTISLLCRSQPSRSCIMGRRREGSSSASCAASRTSITVAAGLLTAPAAPNCCTILTRAMRSCERIWYRRPMAWYCAIVELFMGREPPEEKPSEKPPDDLEEAAASWVSLCHRRTTSLAIGSRW
ncbi:hypothetical protein Trco_003570 [Trichoderma cornu-damae]|uniref:Uncharacterized protein n=1 Tax=Trichoderma cornu-damae TaxID=654480 RepID=A0A9P8QRM3_9HYPO|nr:hypothetical protein Trco_003570 [Trichoderma cornu-damae]